MGTKPLKVLRGYRASNRGSNRGSGGSNRGSKGSRKNTRGSKRLGALFWCPFPFYEILHVKVSLWISYGKKENLKLNLWPRCGLQVQPRRLDRLPKVRGFRTRKLQYIKIQVQSSLGGRFGPEKKIFRSPPPKNPQFGADTLPAPRALPLLKPPPPPGIFNKNRPPTPSRRLGLPLPLQRPPRS